MTVPSSTQLRDAVAESLRTGQRIDIAAYHHLSDVDVALETNEYCFFLKPEIATLGSSAFETAVGLVTQCLNRFQQSPTAVAVLPGRYLERHDLMARHYSVINRYSRLGVSALGAEGRARAAALVGRDEVSPQEVLGGHEFLAEFEFFTPQALCSLHDSLASTKLEPGAYAVRATVEGRPVAVINGFHPLQLFWFYRAASAIIVFVIRTDVPWRTLRREMIGATNPSTAPATTLRGMLLGASADLGFHVSALRNGVHASAGPLEASVEIARYMSDLDRSEGFDLTKTSFGTSASRLLGSGQLRQLGMNPLVQIDEQTASTFDATEETDSRRALEILSKCSVTADAR